MGLPILTGNRVLITSTTTGTSTYALSAAAVSTGYLTPAAAGIASGATVTYCAVDSLTAPTAFEIGRGVVTTGGSPTLTRAVIYRSTGGATSAVNWTAGTRYIYFVAPAELLAMLDTDGVFPLALIPPFVSSLTSPGRLLLPGGYMRQWTYNNLNASLDSGGNATISWTYPTAFPVGVLGGSGTIVVLGSTANVGKLHIAGLTASQMQVVIRDGSPSNVVSVSLEVWGR